MEYIFHLIFELHSTFKLIEPYIKLNDSEIEVSIYYKYELHKSLEDL